MDTVTWIVSPVTLSPIGGVVGEYVIPRDMPLYVAAVQNDYASIVTVTKGTSCCDKSPL